MTAPGAARIRPHLWRWFTLGWLSGAAACDPQVPPCDTPGYLLERSLFIVSDPRGLPLESTGPSAELELTITEVSTGDVTGDRLDLTQTEAGFWRSERFRCDPDGRCRFQTEAPTAPCHPPDVFEVELRLLGDAPFRVVYSPEEEAWKGKEVCPWTGCFLVKVVASYSSEPVPPR